MRNPVELAKAYGLMIHGPVVLVTSAHGSARNVMAAAWSMPIDFSPPKVAVVVDARPYSQKLNDRVFRDGRWNFADDGLRTLHYLSGGTFFATGEAVALTPD